MGIPSKDSYTESYKENRKALGSRVPPDVKVKPEKRTVAHPHPYLSGNFYPVFEETISEDGIECEVIGVIPESLRGSQYIRTGPNSLRIPEETVAHHYFDGEGMLHGVYFPPSVEGEDETGPIHARYMNRWVRSDSFNKANKYGNVMLSVGLMMNGGRSLIRILKQGAVSIFRSMIYNVTNIGNGNTGMIFIRSRLLALHEAGVPIETAVPSLATVGEYYFEKEGQKRSGRNILPNQEACTAHPKHDPKTGETVFFSWRLLPPFAHYSVIAADGSRTIWEESIPGFTRPTMMHDFAITPTYSIILNLNYTLDPIKNWKQDKTLITFDRTKPARFGIIPRHFNSKRDKVLWFETRSCHMFHTANSWDETDKDGNVVAVCMTASRSERFVSYINLWQSTGEKPFDGGKSPEELKTTYVLPGDGDYANQDPDATYMTLFRFDLKTMETRVTTLSSISSEFPMINWNWFMRPDLRYVYAAKMDILPSEGLKSGGVMKMDIRAVMDKQQQLLKEGGLKNAGGEGQWEIGTENLLHVEKETHSMHLFGGAYCGNEALFVPNLPRADGKELEEDEGHLLVYVYDESQIENGLVANPDQQVTELWIFDAKKIGQEHEPVAKVKIPRRVPYGFHGLHVTRKQIEENQTYLKRRAVAV